MKFTLSFAAHPLEIEGYVKITRQLGQKVHGWSYVNGYLSIRCESPRFKVKMKFHDVEHYQRTFLYIRDSRDHENQSAMD